MRTDSYTYYINDKDNNSFLTDKFKSIENDRHENNLVLYNFLQSNDASTAIAAWEYQMTDEFKDILRNCSTEETETGSSPIILATKSFLERYGIEGFDLVKSYLINLASINDTYLISDLMEMLGIVHSQASINERFQLLSNTINIPNHEIRYGVVVGLYNLGGQKAKSILEQRLIKENNPSIANTIKKALNDL